MDDQQLADLKVVALGGGHGLAASLRALRRVVRTLTAVVTVADNGGSSGRLREEFGCLPPGDLRMALAALCDDDAWGRTWADLLQHRFRSDGEMDSHSVGNLLIVALWERLGDHVGGLDLVGRLLKARGRVLPMSVVPIDIAARVSEADGSTSIVRGQKEVAVVSGTVLDVALEPHDPPACPEAVAAVKEADWVVLGPGSWYTSVIPHLLVPELREALTTTSAKIMVVLNLAPQTGETDDFMPEHYLEALQSHAPELRLDVVLCDPTTVGDVDALRSKASELGAELVLADVSCADGTARHDQTKLADAYTRAFSPT